jgi:voltage-gated potassium channel
LLVIPLVVDVSEPVETAILAADWFIWAAFALEYVVRCTTPCLVTGIAAFLMVTGIALFGVLTANIAAFFIEADRPTDGSVSAKLDEVLHRLQAIEERMAPPTM